MTFKIRSYIQNAVESVFEYYDKGNRGNPVIAMPTGTGKSFVIACLLYKLLSQWASLKILALAHVEELLTQNSKALEKIWPNAPMGMYSSGLRKWDCLNNIIFASIQSSYKKASLFGSVSIIIIDECHLVSQKTNSMYIDFINTLKEANPHLKVIGLTATPYRMKQGLLIDEGSIFTDICFDLTDVTNFNWLLSEGYLSYLRPKPTKVQMDVSRIPLVAGEFNQKKLQQSVATQELTYNALCETLTLSSNRRCWLIFTAGIRHAYLVKEILDYFGVSNQVIHSNSKDYKMKGNREDIINGYKNLEFTALINSDMLTTGFDNPFIDLIVMLRPTESVGLWVQMLGRGTRVVYADGYDIDTKQGRLEAIKNSVKKDCLVLDFAGNTKRLGPINNPKIPEKPKKGKRRPQGAPVKICPQCDLYIPASAVECEHCGFLFPREISLEKGASTRELIESKKEELTEIINTYNIDHITYEKHLKAGSIPTLKVSYYCGINKFLEFICIEHSGFVKKKALAWWASRSYDEMPNSVDETLKQTDTLKAPVRLAIKKYNDAYPEIINYFFN